MGAAMPDTPSTPDPASATALNLAQVLWDERCALRGQPLPSEEAAGTPNRHATSGGKDFRTLGMKDLPEMYPLLNADNRWAICLSGGGIRSAAFALGLMQCFAKYGVLSKWKAGEAEPVLQQFDYLSTVSGGGYAGSWFSAWLLQEREQAQRNGGRPGGRASDVLTKLNGRVEDHDEVPPVSNLRRDSHYLAPSFSAISPDVWASIATVVRNLFLNWTLLVPPMIFAVLVTQAAGFAFVDAITHRENPTWIHLATALAAICIGLSSAFASANRPTRGLANCTQAQFIMFDLLVFIVGASLLAFILADPNGREFARSTASSIANTDIDRINPYSILLTGAVLGACLYFVSWFVAFVFTLAPRKLAQRPPDRELWHTAFDLASWCLAGAVFGALVSVGYLLVLWISMAVPFLRDSRQMASLIGVCGVPWIMGARIIGDIVAVAVTEVIPRSDANLEHQARAGGIYALVQVGWLAWFGLVLFGSVLANMAWQGGAAWVVSVGGISGAVSAAAALIIGSSAKTAGAATALKTARQYLGLNTLAAIAAAIFAAILVISLSFAVDQVLKLFPFGSMALFPNGSGGSHPDWWSLATAGALLFAVIVVVSFIININRFSLHGLYRNRLVRAFLGASRDEGDRDRTKNQFTDFDSVDTPLLHQLWQRGVPPRGDDWKPLHIVNVAVNLVSSKNLAWQERMAAPFTFSPLHCGSGSSAFSGGAFRLSYPLGPCKPYGGRHGLTLGTAMAISGAAVSPNMGYNTSPGVAFLMTLFNVRLGWWLGNPQSKNPYYWYTGPGFALRPLFMEMFGLTSEKERWVYLSDGGHFENLGLYEMVRRRCRVIVVSDAGCDPGYEFDDLGNAVRKIWIDLGVQIDFIGLDRLKKRFSERPTPARSEPYWAVGRIRYTLADGKIEGTDDGWLLYIKAGIHGTEPMDVLSYAVSHPTFPHETTANQFFSESQFESYRMLGYEIASNALQYAEREVAAASTPATSKDTLAKPASEFQVLESTMTLDQVVKHLHIHLKRPSDPPGRAEPADPSPPPE
jgi:hypothetical protein